MKTLNLKKKITMAWALLVITLGLSVACNKKDNNSNPAPVGGAGGYGTNGCMNCNFAQGILAQAQSQGSSSFPVTINWQIIGDQNMVNMVAMQGYSIKNYTGPIALQGAMNISQTIQAGYCLIPAGQYQVSSVQAGSMTGGVMQVPQLVANVGGAQIIFALSGAVGIDANGDGQFDRIAGNFVPVQGPGYNYGGGMYPGGYQYPGYNNGMVGGMVSCNDIGVYLQ